MQRPIVVGIDGSGGAQQALRWAIEEGRRRSLPVVAAMVWSYFDQHLPDDAARGFDPGYGEDDARAALDAYVAAAVGHAPDLRREVVCDIPARGLADLSLQATLVVVGARGSGGFAGLGLGSTADGLLTRSATPVVIVRDAEGDGPVVVGVDGSAGGAAALRWAIGEARARDGRLRAVTAWARPALAAWTFEDDAPLFAKLARRAGQLLDDALAGVDTSGVDVERLVVEGSPSAALLGTQPAALLVVGSRGLNALAGAVVGSTSRQLAHHANVPVVVVPENSSMA